MKDGNMTGYPSIRHGEECMRDGMQIEDRTIPVADKIRLLDALSETGLKEIAVGSFVSPKWTPQMAEVEAVITGFHPKPGVRYTAATFNERGRERARAFTPPLSPSGRGAATQVNLCDVFAQRNYNRTQAQELAGMADVVRGAQEQGIQEGAIGLRSAFGSNWTGEFSHEQHMRLLDRQYQVWSEAGIRVKRVSIADPMSWNMPHRVERLLVDIKSRWPSVDEFNLHLHNGRAMALPSVYAALRTLDSTDVLGVQSSIGGMAGCPYCGNGRAAMMIATEDLMHMLEDMGIYTGVDLYKLIEVVWLAEEILGHQLYGFVSKAGPRPRYGKLYPMDMPFVETLDEAKHFLRGPATYAQQSSPWKAPITSWMRPTLVNGAPEPHTNGANSEHLAAGATHASE
jgi:hydroxymethylglutaryl-CoA lyase